MPNLGLAMCLWQFKSWLMSYLLTKDACPKERSWHNGHWSSDPPFLFSTNWSWQAQELYYNSLAKAKTSSTAPQKKDNRRKWKRKASWDSCPLNFIVSNPGLLTHRNVLKNCNYKKKTKIKILNLTSKSKIFIKNLLVFPFVILAPDTHWVGSLKPLVLNGRNEYLIPDCLMLRFLAFPSLSGKCLNKNNTHIKTRCIF